MITIAARAPKVEVPRLTNKRADAARRILKELGVRARIRRVFHDVIETGHVIRTRPGVGAKVDPDTFIDVYVAE